jgi:hypothetical protein
VRLTLDHKVEEVIQEIVDSNSDLYKRITDDRDFGETIKNLLFDQYLRAHRNAEDLVKSGESKTRTRSSRRSPPSSTRRAATC